jgi:cell division protein FtsQ
VNGLLAAGAGPDAVAPGAADVTYEPNDLARGAPPRTRGARAARRAAAALVAGAALAAAAAAPAWGPRALGRLAYFRVRRVEVEGARYASPAELVARMAVDTGASVWADLEPLAARVRAHPLVARAMVERRLPSVLVVRVVERVPVAMAAGAAGMSLYDSAGALLPVAPARASRVDVPVVAGPDRALLRALGALRATAPALYARVSEARRGRGGRDELVFALTPEPGPAAPRAGANAAPQAAAPPTAVLMRAAPGVAAARFADAALVERDLARRGVRPLELDLRFRDQVVARLP